MGYPTNSFTKSRWQVSLSCRPHIKYSLLRTKVPLPSILNWFNYIYQLILLQNRSNSFNTIPYFTFFVGKFRPFLALIDNTLEFSSTKFQKWSRKNSIFRCWYGPYAVSNLTFSLFAGLIKLTKASYKTRIWFLFVYLFANHLNFTGFEYVNLPSLFRIMRLQYS